jgi:hypothetical protein
VSSERVNYGGWANSWRISNGEIELVVTGDVGPRVISFGFAGGQNLFKNYDEQVGGSGEPAWMIRGGSRIWVGPEDRVASYALDNSPVEVEAKDGVITATGPVEPETSLQKQMIVRMAPRGAEVEIVHRIRNSGSNPADFAVWVLTVMAPGGVGITGFPPRGTHPEDLEPSNPLVMWPYTDLSDPRWRFTKKYLALMQDADAATPQKVGSFNENTWGAYLLKGELFVKRYAADKSQRYPDMGCSFETFTNRDMLELETMGPLRRVAPGEWSEHVERWSLHRGVTISRWADDELDRVLRPLTEC